MSSVNAVRRRLLRVYVEFGGDLRNDTEVERFLGRVESLMAVLPPRVRDAVELAWQSAETPGYEHMARELAARCGAPVSVVALRQRVSRGMRTLERTIRIGQGHADLAVLTRRPG